MRKLALVFALLLVPGFCHGTDRLAEFDRTGSTFVAPKLGLSFPVGALADANYQLIASSWRKEGFTLTGEVGYYITNSTAGGLEVSYSSFNPKDIGAFAGGSAVDKSRVRIRRFGVYLQYFMVSTGKYRPFMKLGAGLFEASRISMPQVNTTPVEYKDYSLGAKPVMSIGAGVHGTINSNLSVTFSIEAVSLNSFSSSWETAGATVGPLHKNILFFPVYFGIVYHLNQY